ncbi:MAG: ATP-binding protein [Gallionellaceae bacterium]
MTTRTFKQIVVCDKVDEQLLPILLEEAHELYPKICLTFKALREKSGEDSVLSNQLQRTLHTFKGGARMAGAMHLGELLHRVEGRIAEASRLAVFDASLWLELERCLSCLETAIEALSGSANIANAKPEFISSVLLHRHTGRFPFASVSSRLYNVTRQTAKELCKRVNFELSGGETEIEANVLERLTAPFEHLLRNAISHGIESAERREYLGKSAIGQISLSLHREHKELVFEFGDDGQGLDIIRLKQKALELGILQEGEELSETQAIKMIFTPGLSTASEITELSGRGIGLDVVRAEVEALVGHLQVVSRQDNGLSFRICLPEG